MAPSCALLGTLAIGARVALLWQHNTNPSYKLACTPRYDNILRTKNVKAKFHYASLLANQLAVR